MKYLLDSNVVIEYLSEMLPEKASLFIDKLPIQISVVTKMEILGWYEVNHVILKQLQDFIDRALVYDLSNDVVVQTIHIRQRHKIKLPDAIIAATALTTGAKLITHNIRDFEKINNLSLIDSHCL